jgi:hypothetical protein
LNKKVKRIVVYSNGSFRSPIVVVVPEEWAMVKTKENCFFFV